MNIRIEPAGPEHLPEIAALAALIWRAHYPGIISPAQIEYMLARMYDVGVMRDELAAGLGYDRLLLEGELRGFASYGLMPVAGELKLHKLYVHPDFQRRGLGARLVEHVQFVARARGCTTLMLAVNKQNVHARDAYEKHGFTVRESVVTDIGGGFVMDDYIMARSVRAAAAGDFSFVPRNFPAYRPHMTRQQILDLYFMEARAKLIDLAAFLDRVERAEGEADFRFTGFRAALQQLSSGDASRARNVLLSLSDPTTEPIAAATTKAAAGAWPGR